MKTISPKQILKTEKLAQFKMDIHLWTNCQGLLIILCVVIPPPALTFEQYPPHAFLSDEGRVCEKIEVGSYIHPGS
jgi:hypothetical protein